MKLNICKHKLTNSISRLITSIKSRINMYSKVNSFDTNNKRIIYNLLVLKGEALLKGQFLARHKNLNEGDGYSNFFTAISAQVDPLLIYFINDEISASLHERGPLRGLIKEVKNDHFIDEHFKYLQYAESDLQLVFSERTNFIIGSNILGFKVDTYSVFEKYIGNLYDNVLLSHPRSNKNELKLIKLIEKYSNCSSNEEKASTLEKIKKISFYVSSAEKIEYVLSHSALQNEKEDEIRKFLNFYRSQRNTIHNLGVHSGEEQSITVRGIEIKLDKDMPGYTEDHNSAIFACHELMDIYETIHASITGEKVF